MFYRIDLAGCRNFRDPNCKSPNLPHGINYDQTLREWPFTFILGFKKFVRSDLICINVC